MLQEQVGGCEPLEDADICLQCLMSRMQGFADAHQVLRTIPNIPPASHDMDMCSLCSRQDITACPVCRIQMAHSASGRIFVSAAL